MKVSNNYIDTIFDFCGEWDVKSQCGLQITEINGNFIVIVTELPDNPGTKITTFSAELAGLIGVNYNIPPEKMIYIEHFPEMNSKLSFYNETFYRVHFKTDNGMFSSPVWEKLTKQEVDKLINNKLK